MENSTTTTTVDTQTSCDPLLIGGRSGSDVVTAARAAGLVVRDDATGVQMLKFAHQLNSDELRLMEMPHEVLHALKIGERLVEKDRGIQLGVK